MRPVVWSIETLRDHLEILRSIAEDDPFAAERVVDAIEQAGSKLGDIATGQPGRVSGTYEKSLTRLSCIIAFELRDMADRESVVIVRVIHTSRYWPSEEWPDWLNAMRVLTLNNWRLRPSRWAWLLSLMSWPGLPRLL